MITASNILQKSNVVFLREKDVLFGKSGQVNVSMRIEDFMKTALATILIGLALCVGCAKPQAWQISAVYSPSKDPAKYDLGHPRTFCSYGYPKVTKEPSGLYDLEVVYTTGAHNYYSGFETVEVFLATDLCK